MIRDVGEADFQANVIERSREVPVVVDFWAAWCGPCRSLSPALEQAARAREGRVDLAKVDVDANQRLAQAFRVQGIPAVKAVRDGRVVEEFTGAVPPAQVERFFDALVPSQAELDTDGAIIAGDEDALRQALESNPRNARVAVALAKIELARGDADAAAATLADHQNDFVASGLAARIELSAADDQHAEVFAAWDARDHAAALERLEDALAGEADADARDRIRRVMIAIFTELGPDSELAREHRRRLSAVLY